MATIGSRRALSAPVDLNRVRLQALLGATDDALRRLSVQALAPPEWLDAQRCTCWAFAFGRGHFVLEDALRQADEASRRLPPLGAYRRSRDVLAHVLAWLRAQSRGGGVGFGGGGGLPAHRGRADSHHARRGPRSTVASPVRPARGQLSVRVDARVSSLVCGALALSVGACEPLPPPTYSGQHPAHVRRARAFEPMTGVEYENRFEARVYEMMQSPACAEAPVYALIDEEPPPSVGGTSLGFCDGLMVRLLESGGSEVWGMGPASGSPAGWESRAFALGSLWVRTELPHGVEVRTVEGDGGVRLVRRRGFDLRVLPANAEDVAGPLDGARGLRGRGVGPALPLLPGRAALSGARSHRARRAGVRGRVRPRAPREPRAGR